MSFDVDITDIRSRLEEACAGLEVGTVGIKLGPSEYASTGPELHFLVTVLVGPPTEENQEVVDELFNRMPRMLNGAEGLNTYTSRCSGHRLYARGPDEEPELGAEWVVKVFT